VIKSTINFVFNLIKRIFRYFWISLFFSFYIVAIAVNYNHINNFINPLEKLHLKKEYKIDNSTYLSTFPSREDLIRYKKKYHIQRVVALLNYKRIISKSLLKDEEKVCKELGIELVYIPVSLFSKNPMDYNLVKVLLKEYPKVTLIHSYWFDNRMEMIKKILSANSN